MEHLPHSPDLAPNDFWLFTAMKFALNRHSFQDTEDMKKKVTVLKAVPQQEFQKCFQQWRHRWIGAQLLKGSTSKVTPLSKV
jgi:hypothetical protein